MSIFIPFLAIILILIVIFQIAKASEYVSVLKGEDRAFKQNNKINGALMIAFLVLGLIGVFWCNHELYPKTLFPQGSASVEGEKVDQLLKITIWLTGFVFVITQIALFWFAYKYQYKKEKKAYFFSHSNKLEVIWTVVPSIVLAILIVYGLRSWFLFTGDAPKGAMQVEVTGKQFQWLFRYRGKDGVFGKKYFRDISSNNQLGLIWKDSAELNNQKADPAAFDDIVMSGTVYLVKNKPVEFLINSQDVIHDVGLPHFRMKMDAVPGTPTRLWFTPKYTTEEMKKITNNPDFVYELSCDQLCGKGHFSMKATIVVLTQAEFDAQIAKEKPDYYNAFPDKDPDNKKPVVDSTKSSTTNSTKTVAAADTMKAAPTK